MSNARQLALAFEASILPRKLEGIVNVASVPQRSPFRYPGGKTWLVPTVRRWLMKAHKRPALLVEPFAGGAIIGLTVGAEGLAEHVTLVELDEDVAAVWLSIFGGDADWLANRIMAFPLTADAVHAALAAPVQTIRERAFLTILKNRVNHGGIMAPGAGVIKHGENRKGLTSRWYPETLCQRIMNLAAIAERFSVVQGDGMLQIERHAADPHVSYFIDPPYTVAGNGKRAGRRLYTHFDVDHASLFRLAARVRGDILLTYDDAPEVASMAREYGLDTHRIPMKNTHHAEMYELLIGKDLSWAR